MPQKKNFRKRKVESDSDGDDDDTRRQKMKEAKELQHLRSKAVGITPEDLLGVSKGRVEEVVEEENDHTLESTFTDSATADKTEQEKKMAAWVDEQMGGEGGAKGEDKPTSFNDLQAELFATPAGFEAAVAPNKDRLAEEATWLTGISEFQLPLDYKIKNIEATDAAKRNLIASKQANLQKKENPEPTFSQLPRSVTADYRQHRKTHFEEVVKPRLNAKEKQQAQPGASAPSDATTMAQFKNKQRVSRRW